MIVRFALKFKMIRKHQSGRPILIFEFVRHIEIIVQLEKRFHFKIRIVTVN